MSSFKGEAFLRYWNEVVLALGSEVGAAYLEAGVLGTCKRNATMYDKMSINHACICWSLQQGAKRFSRSALDPIHLLPRLIACGCLHDPSRVSRGYRGRL